MHDLDIQQSASNPDSSDSGHMHQQYGTRRHGMHDSISMTYGAINGMQQHYQHEPPPPPPPSASINTCHTKSFIYRCLQWASCAPPHRCWDAHKSEQCTAWMERATPS
jgi:hypothetical protein